jgi:UDP-N-acetylmuramoyl-tripeptide--D-alanyl-D-alanine ligase
MKLTKKDILSIPHIQASDFDTSGPLDITGVSINSRTVKPGELFVAIRGDQFDGHNFISTAVEQGASALIVEKRWASGNITMLVSLNLPILVVENTVHALGRLATIHRRRFDIPVLAVAGSNGKTTTKEMIENVLSAKYSVLCTQGNLNNHIGVPQTLLRIEKEHEIAVLEIGTNHPGEITYLCNVAEPTHGIITNIGREHLEFFGTIEGAAKAEGELLHWLADHHGIFLSNADDARIVRLAKKMKKAVTYGFSARGTKVKGSGLEMNEQACASFFVKTGNKKNFHVQLTVPSEHNAKNALAAAAAGLTFKVKPADIQKSLEEFSSVSKRMQLLTIGGVTIINDTYNANPDSMTAALKTLKATQTTGKRIAVLADMLELGSNAPELHRQIGESAGACSVDILLTFGELAAQISEAAIVNAKAHFEIKAALIESVLRTIVPGDVLLVKGSRGMKMEDVVAAINDRFSQPMV